MANVVALPSHTIYCGRFAFAGQVKRRSLTSSRSVISDQEAINYLRRYLKFAALCLIAALALWWFGHNLPWAEVRREVGQADWRLIALATLVVCTTYFTRALRWRVLLAPLAPARLLDLFAATTVGFGAIFSVGRAGEVLRPAFLPLRDRRVRPTAETLV